MTLAVVVGTVALWRSGRGSAVIALGLLPVLGAAVVWASGEPILTQRNMLPVVPFMAILVAAAVDVLPRRFVRAVAAAAMVATVAGAAFAHATLGRISHDSVADALVDVGWTAEEPVVVHLPGVKGGTEMSLATPLAWYLPDRPDLVRARAPRSCRTRFAVVRAPDVGRWLARRRGLVARVRDVASYDHLIRGRETGRIVIARLRTQIDLRGEIFYVRARTISCLRRTS